MAEKYVIKTIKDIENVITEKNVECFKKDFCKWLDFMIAFKKAAEIMPIKIAPDRDFIWIDDGKNNATIRIIAENEKK